MSNQTISGKRRARKLALQALYQWHMSGTDLHEIEVQFRVINNMEKVNVDYFCQLLHDIPRRLVAIEEAITPLLDRPLTSLNPVELAILRICGYEMLFCPELPYRVILDESVSLAKEFGAQEGHRYVNGVLHNLATLVRAVEMNQPKA